MDGPAATLSLRDIHLPDAVSWWPPAPGWWALLVLCFLMVFSVWLFRLIKYRRSVRVAAIQSLQDISATFLREKDAHQLVKSLSILLRRICLSYFPRSEVAGLTGEKWLAFLDHCLDWGNVSERFSQGAGRTLITAPYQPQSTLQGEQLLNLCQHWIKALPLLKGKHP